LRMSMRAVAATIGADIMGYRGYAYERVGWSSLLLRPPRSSDCPFAMAPMV
jgi:hypothetical protein